VGPAAHVEFSGQLPGNRMDRTKKSYIALISPIAAVEDAVVFVLKGSSVPPVFRDRGANWALIGHAYVPGLMKGEQWYEAKCQEIRIG